MAVIHFIYGVADGNALEVRRLYGERFPSRRLPNPKTFERLHRRLRETGSFVSGMHDTRRTISARIPELEEHVLCEFGEQPETNTWTVSTAANVNHMTVWLALGAKGLRPYHAQCVHALKATDHHLHVHFSRWFLQRLAVQLDFATHLQCVGRNYPRSFDRAISSAKAPGWWNVSGISTRGASSSTAKCSRQHKEYSILFVCATKVRLSKQQDEDHERYAAQRYPTHVQSVTYPAKLYLLRIKIGFDSLGDMWTCIILLE
ncbi:uncharacterized protein TNCV_2974651 [Trichonephila clavipes]|nr:uncharacterized protein TNCV_2974651 [Trichonephila clavipes]